jgi:phosphate starvation-inducible protein PhoH and related proteins
LDALEVTVRFPARVDRVAVVGSSERNLKMLREALGVRLTAKDHAVHVSGDKDAVFAARRVIEHLSAAAQERRGLSRQQVLDLIAEEAADAATLPEDLLHDTTTGEPWDGKLSVYASGRVVKARSDNQQHYLDAIRDNDLVFALGPAGTGKTYLAVAAAVHLLKTDRVRKLVLTRPAVEAGEKLGFLPGDIEAKVNPYLRPLLDALHDMMDYHTVRRFMDSDVVEVVPLAFMRGRTMNNAVVILDEAQNTTKGQMKMFLTRLGQGSKMIVTGDPTQIDLPDPRESGVIDAAARLRRTKGVGFVALDRNDVVRHQLVQRIIDAYGNDDPSPGNALESFDEVER